MSSLSIKLRRLVGVVAVIAVAGGVAAVDVPAAIAAKPADSLAEVIFQADPPDGNPAHSLTDGWWGHEGVGKNVGTFPYFNQADSNGQVTDASKAAIRDAFGIADYTDLRIAFVPTSIDGSAERPHVTAGQNAGQVFTWFTKRSFSTGWFGSAVPEVNTISTLSEYADWVAAGSPDIVYDGDTLDAYDLSNPENPVIAEHPGGKSVLNRWAAGQKISMVVFLSAGSNADGIPLVAVGSDGRAKSAWLSFTTTASPTSAVATSAGYHVEGVKASPTVTLTHSLSDGAGNLSAAISPDIAGTLQFTSSACPAGAFADAGAAIHRAAGSGPVTLPLAGFGSSAVCATYKATFTPDDLASYNVVTSGVRTVAGVDAPVVVQPPVVQPPVHVQTPPLPKVPIAAKEAKQIKKTGTAKVGKTVKVAVPKKIKSKAKVSYQWYASGKTIKGAKKSSFKIGKTYKGKKLTVIVTYKKAGYSPYTKTLSIGKVKK